jgi:hypothetical protein
MHSENQVINSVFFHWNGQLSFPEMVWPIDLAPIHLYLEDAAVHACNKVLMEVDNAAMIIGNPQGILGKQLRPHPIHFLNIIIFSLLIKFVN